MPSASQSSSADASSGESSRTSAGADDWPLTDWSTLAQGPSATTATNTITGAAATLNGGINWSDDDYFSTGLNLGIHAAARPADIAGRANL